MRYEDIHETIKETIILSRVLVAIDGVRNSNLVYWTRYTIIQLGTTVNHSATADFHNFQFTVAHALGFSVSTDRLLATDLNTGTITSNHYEVFLPFLLQSPWTAESPLDIILQFSSLNCKHTLISLRVGSHGKQVHCPATDVLLLSRPLKREGVYLPVA
jgi:hypothetical protein